MTIEKVVVGQHILYTGDCLEVMKQLPKESVKLIITDPPYNIGLNYGKFKDRQTKEKYFQWLKIRINQMARILTKDGSLYLINYPELNAYTMPTLDKKLIFRRWLTWHYPTNIGHSKKNWTRSQRSILFYTKSNNYTFNRNEILQPYKNLDVGKIKKRIAAGYSGRGPYDTFKLEDIAEILKEPLDLLQVNLLKNVCKDRRLEHPCQLPGDLIKVLMKASSNTGDIILDPFAGTFMVSLVAKELQRKSIGIEINSKYVKIGRGRLI
ncbi:MAG: DNA methyltransferase [Methanobacteriota archaeon]